MIKYYTFDERHHDVKTTTPENGFARGNMFADEYIPYKTYPVTEVVGMTEQEKLLYTYLMYNFAAHDLNLYLDTHPDNKAMITLYAKYSELAMKTKKLYESKYGPLDVNDISDGENYWEWIKGDWPWEGYRV